MGIFSHADILVLVSEFVVVVILSEWWLLPTTVGTSLILTILPASIYVRTYVDGNVHFKAYVHAYQNMHILYCSSNL